MENSKDPLGDRIKAYESKEAGRHLMSELPVMVRLDGKGFSRWTACLKKPYDLNLSRLMVETTKYLMQECSAIAGYTQSDEISLVLWNDNPNAQLYFGGKIQKLTSVLASYCTAYFNGNMYRFIPGMSAAIFDCRVWNVPSKTEATNSILWRQFDCVRNSISCAAQTVYSHKELDAKSTPERKNMLLQKGIDWDRYADIHKYGTILVKKDSFKEIELQSQKSLVPTKIIMERCIEPISNFSNREDIIFKGEEPIK